MITSEILKLVSWEIFDPWLPFAVSTLFTVLVSCYTFRLTLRLLAGNERKNCNNKLTLHFPLKAWSNFAICSKKSKKISATRYMMGRSSTVGGVQVSSEVLSQREALLVRPPCPHQAMQCNATQCNQASFVIRHITTQPPRPSL